MEKIIKRHKRFFALFAVVAMLFSLARPEGYKQVTASETTDTEIATNNDAQQEPEEVTQNDASAEFIQNEKVDESAKTLFVRVEESGASITVNAPAGSLPYPEGELSLAAREIKEGTADYEYYLTESADVLNCDSAESIAYARFFDIEILRNGEKIEPLSPVEVKIEYDDAPEISSDEELSIVHFAEDGTEIISDIDVNCDASEITYEQESFSVTATIVVGEPPDYDGISTDDNSEYGNSYYEQGRPYIIVAKKGDNVYTVKADGSLSKALSYDADSGKLVADDAFAWTYYKKDGKAVLKYVSDGYDYGSDDQATLNGYTFIDPSAKEAISQEQVTSVEKKENQNVKPNTITTLERLDDECEIFYDNVTNTIQSVASGKYLSIDEDEKTIVGGESTGDGVKFYLASADDVKAYIHVIENMIYPNDTYLLNMLRNHQVNHIDISIKDTVQATIVLAYGDYYDKDGNKVLTVDSDSPESVKSFIVNQQYEVSQKHLREALIETYKRNDDGTPGDKLENQFIITGYSSNNATKYSENQVRIDGVFKVAYCEPVDISENRTDLTWVPNFAEWTKNRLKSRILYKVTATEPEVKFMYDHPEYGQLYDPDGNALFTKGDVTVEATFDYFDIKNECPPLQRENPEDNPNVSGVILNSGTSGMDFVLSGESTVDLKPYAIEIENVVMDKDGNPIIPAEPITFTHAVYVKEDGDPDSVIGNNVGSYNGDDVDTTGYKKIHEKKTEIDNTEDGNGTGTVYDYSIPQGMVYVTEDASTIPATFVDVDGNTWEYSHTYIETEYIWRENDANNGKKHITDNYDDPSDSYSSIPEVVGEYGTEFNKFLEFYVRNVYDKVIPPTKKEYAPYEGNGTLGALQAGDEITYEISYTNYKSIDSDVIIKDTLDKNVEFVSASDGGKLNNGVVTWNIPNVGAGTEDKVTLTVRVLESALESNGGPGKVVNGGRNSNGENTATVQIGDGAEYGLEEVINPVPESPVKQEVSPYKGTGKLGTVKVDDEITYEISYKNYKDAKADIVITDKLDGNVEYVSSSDDGAYNNATRVVKWTLKDVPAGKEGMVTLKVKVLDGALKDNGGPGVVINGGDDSEASNGSTATVTVGDDIPYILDQVENPVEAKEEDETPEDTVDDTPETTDDTPATDEEETPDKEVGNLVITVVEEETSRVVSEAEVEVIYPDKEEKTYTTDEVGRVTLKDVPAGDYTITIKKVPDGYKVSTTEVLTGTVVEGKTTEVEFKIVVTTNTDKIAKTDDPTQTGVLVFAMILSAAGIIFLADRKRKNRNEQ